MGTEDDYRALAGLAGFDMLAAEDISKKESPHGLFAFAGRWRD